MLSQTLKSIQRAVSLFPDSSSASSPLISSHSSSVAATFKYWPSSQPKTQYSDSLINCLDFQNLSDSPAYSCDLAETVARIHSQLLVWIHPGVNPFIHLSICLDSHSAKRQTIHLSVTQSFKASSFCYRMIMEKWYPCFESKVNHKLAAEVPQKEGHGEVVFFTPVRYIREEKFSSAFGPLFLL